MSIPELTKIGIAPFNTEEVNEILDQRFSDDEIPQLFNDVGVLRKGEDGVFNICMKWHRNELDVVDGVFVRIIFEGNLIAWLNPAVCRNDHNFIWIKNGMPILREKPIMGGGLCFEVDGCLKLAKTGDASPRFEVEHLDNPEAIAAFFDQDRHVLPDILRARIFPPVIPPDPIGDIHPRNRTYVIGGLLLVLAVGYIAHRIIDKYRAPQTPPGEHLEKALQTQNLVSAT